jgi:hypothetical protein
VLGVWLQPGPAAHGTEMAEYGQPYVHGSRRVVPCPLVAGPAVGVNGKEDSWDTHP